MVSDYLSNIDKQLREERKRKIFSMWLACYSQEEIAESVGVDQMTVKRETDTFTQIGSTSDLSKSRDFSQDDEIATYGDLGSVSSFAKSRDFSQDIVDNLLYLSFLGVTLSPC